MSIQLLAAMPSGYPLHGSYPVVDLSPQQYEAIVCSLFTSTLLLCMVFVTMIKLWSIISSRVGLKYLVVHIQQHCTYISRGPLVPTLQLLEVHDVLCSYDAHFLEVHTMSMERLPWTKAGQALPSCTRSKSGTF